MNPDIKREWLAALATAKQGRGALRPEGKDEYCCLGVLCNVAAAHNLGHWDELQTGRNTAFVTRPERHPRADTALLPGALIAWAGMSEEEGGAWFTVAQIREALDDAEIARLDGVWPLDQDGVRYSLVELNDEGVSFATIAKLIDRHL